MISRKLSGQLDSLKAIKPRTEWRDRTREVLLAQITAQGVATDRRTPVVGQALAYTTGLCVTAYRQTFEQLFARPLVLSGVLSAVVVAAVSIVVASQGSMPGDPLYTLKRTEEQVRVVFVSPQERSRLQLDLAGKRLEELSFLAERQISEDEKSERATQLAKDAGMSIASAREDLMRLTKETPEKAAAIAAQIKEQATRSQEQATKAASGSAQETSAVADVIARLDETKGAALQVIVEKKDAANISDSEVAAHLEEAITDLEGRLARLQNVSAAGFQGEGGEQAAKAHESLQKARESLERNDFTIALAGIKESRDIIVAGERGAAAAGDAVRTDENGLK